jgi:hypothetical protein
LNSVLSHLNPALSHLNPVLSHLSPMLNYLNTVLSHLNPAHKITLYSAESKCAVYYTFSGSDSLRIYHLFHVNFILQLCEGPVTYNQFSNVITTVYHCLWITRVCDQHITLLILFSVPDNRCFLESGGSAESFFVSEDQPVGAVIGKFKKILINYICIIYIVYIIYYIYSTYKLFFYIIHNIYQLKFCHICDKKYFTKIKDLGEYLLSLDCIHIK